MSEIFKLLRSGKQASQIANDLKGRLPFTYLGIVTRNDDPLGKRRIKCTLQHTGGKVETDWLWRSTNSHSDDPQIPKPGMTVEVRFINGDPHQGIYGGVITNLPNPERESDDPINDDARTIEGDRVLKIGKDDILTVGETQTIEVGKSLTIKAGERIKLQVGGYTLELTSSGVTINGKDVATIGAVDSDGDVLETRGY
ncbi:hypothetical protein IQ268_08845 [Oculatella sp. LEGE 06141]|uniref:phage baseplate assembly protein V n=1 Tax=Oculatella sp. LEGE 06141 TaxID=1828648 RepID=UPI00188055B5|nr:phage baseplate assembly protein V [Oculatella sp. LEGE 06141]MBE9178665.1 hypothetical protein [Oculatella sp. LEGE 06141]